MKVGEYNNRVAIDGITQISDSDLTFGDLGESASRCKRGSSKLKQAGNNGIQHG
jgi:hypothetical protein